MGYIYVFICYYGKFPNYFQLYLDSVANNADILRIVLISDIDLSSYVVPSNVIHFNISFNAVKTRVQQFLNDELHCSIDTEKILKTHYKLCDCRPIYHRIFNDIYNTLKLDANDYIGWSDIDLIYGKLSSYIDLSKNYNIIGIQGHLTAIKNDEKYTNVYKHVNRLADRIIDERSMYVDENTYIDTFMDIHKDDIRLFKVHNYNCDISHYVKELTMVGRRSEIIHYLEYNKSSGKLNIYFADGPIQETIYCHLQKRPMTVEFETYDTAFYIHESSFSLNPIKKSEIEIVHSFDNKVTIVLTSCNRPFLLEKTLASFVKYNTYPIFQTIIIDDSGKLMCNSEVCKKFPQLNITEIYNISNIGQVASIDKAYAMVKTKWIFHCEEDWEFLDYGFIEKSMEILNNDISQKIFTVWLRPHNNTNYHPVMKDGLNRGYYDMMHEYSYTNAKGFYYTWYGITFNPGLRRTSTCMKFHPLMSQCESSLFDYKKIGEYHVNQLFGKQGYYSVILDKESGYVAHIGWDHSTNPSR